MVHTTPFDILATLPVAEAVSSVRDCYAKVGTTVLGGWTISHDSELVRAEPEESAVGSPPAYAC